jgi:hypothetical protein
VMLRCLGTRKEIESRENKGDLANDDLDRFGTGEISDVSTKSGESKQCRRLSEIPQGPDRD